MPDDRTIPDGLRNIILKMLDKNPESRATIEDIKKEKWLNEGFTVELNNQAAEMGMMSHLKSVEMDELHKTTVLYAKKIAQWHS